MRRSRKASPLPVRDGVSAQSLFLPPGAWPSLLAFLCQRFPAVSEVQWRQRMAQGDVADAQGNPLGAAAPYVAGLHIYYYRTVEQEQQVPFQETILFEDAHLLVVDKPHFLPTQPSGPFLRETLVARLRRRLGNDQLEPLHRLDRETAGLVLFAKDKIGRATYQPLFRDQRITKVYQAIAPTLPDVVFPLTRCSRIGADPQFYRRREVDGEPNAETRIELMEAHAGWARYRLQPATGKTHQLRIHMAALGAPIRHDPLYPVDLKRQLDDFTQPLQLLAMELAFTDPLSGQPRLFRSARNLELP